MKYHEELVVVFYIMSMWVWLTCLEFCHGEGSVWKYPLVLAYLLSLTVREGLIDRSSLTERTMLARFHSKVKESELKESELKESRLKEEEVRRMPGRTIVLFVPTYRSCTTYPLIDDLSAEPSVVLPNCPNPTKIAHIYVRHLFLSRSLWVFFPGLWVFFPGGSGEYEVRTHLQAKVRKIKKGRCIMSHEFDFSILQTSDKSNRQRDRNCVTCDYWVHSGVDYSLTMRWSCRGPRLVSEQWPMVACAIQGKKNNSF